MEYRYRRERMPASPVWHMNCFQSAEGPDLLTPGEMRTSDEGDQISIYVAVPCDMNGGVDKETLAEYEDLADERFAIHRPNATLA
jgi:hypothetical protein